MGRAHGKLALIVLLSFFLGATISDALAQSPREKRTMDDALDLMYAARGILLEDDVDEDAQASVGHGLLMVIADVPPNSPAEQILVRLINTTKRELGDVEKACRDLRGSFSEPGQECEEKLSRAYCDSRQAQLKARLSLLRKVRGDRRKAFTKGWHSVKRAGARFWRNIGPVGRRFLRDLGKEAFTVVKSGGSLHGGVLRRLVIKHARNVGQRHVKNLLTRSIQKKILGEAQIAGEDCGESLSAEAKPESDSITCQNEDWFDETWIDLEVVLIVEGKNCQVSALRELRGCLWEKALNGVCKDEAVQACQNLFNAIPPNDAGGSVTMTGQSVFLDATPNEATITYPSLGGKATGRIHFQRYDDVFGCTYTVTTEVVGQYDPKTCTMRGEATSELIYQGYCVSVCGSGPSSPTSCPVTMNRTTVWEATLEDGVLNGAVGDESCDRGCYTFRAPGYGLDP